MRLSSFGKTDYKEKIEKLLKQFSDRLEKAPLALPLMASILSTWVKGPLLLVGKNKKLNEVLLPVSTVVIDSDLTEELCNAIPVLKALDKADLAGKIYAKRGTADWIPCPNNVDEWIRSIFAE